MNLRDPRLEADGTDDGRLRGQCSEQFWPTSQIQAIAIKIPAEIFRRHLFSTG
jgi:hypothetical protein